LLDAYTAGTSRAHVEDASPEQMSERAAAAIAGG
jgi:hypothetical protein